MNIALASSLVCHGNVEFNVCAMEDAMTHMKGKADVIVFGETALQGFNCLSWSYERDVHMALTYTDQPIQRLCAAARTNNMALSFGWIEKDETSLYSSQLFIGSDGSRIHNFRRVSPGWKVSSLADSHYCEGKSFSCFTYSTKRFSIGLCGDLWTKGRPEEMRHLSPDIVLWPVWCDYDATEWNTQIKYEYANQAALCAKKVLLVNPFCVSKRTDEAAGACAYFCNGKIQSELPAGNAGILLLENV